MTNEELPKEIPCFLCGDFQTINISKTDKPYFICNDCGMQVFIRKVSGIKRLSNLINDPDLKDIYLNGKYLSNSKLFRIKERINLINSQLDNLDIFTINNKDLELETALRSKLKTLEDQLINYLNK